MRKFVVALSLISLPALGFPTGSFQGGGDWKMPDGAQGTWSETFHTSEADDHLVLTSSLEIFVDGDVVHTEETELKLFAIVGNGFYDVVSAEGTVIGTAACYPETCQIDARIGSETYTETYHYGNGRLYKVGSSVEFMGDTEFRVAWRGLLNPVSRGKD